MDPIRKSLACMWRLMMSLTGSFRGERLNKVVLPIPFQWMNRMKTFHVLCEFIVVHGFRSKHTEYIVACQGGRVSSESTSPATCKWDQQETLVV